MEQKYYISDCYPLDENENERVIQEHQPSQQEPAVSELEFCVPWQENCVSNESNKAD